MRDCQKRLSTAFFDNKVPRRRRKLHILRSRLRPRAQSFRCSSSPTKCILRFVGSVGGRWRPALRFVVASCISFAPGLGRELSHSAAPPLPMSAIRTHWEPEVFSATYTPPPKMIAVPFAPMGRETLRGLLQAAPARSDRAGAFCVLFRPRGLSPRRRSGG